MEKAWNAYVPKNLLPRINAFELMMAPYAVAHMKLAMVLKDTGYNFENDQRLNVYLTNSLEEAGNSDGQLTFWSDPLATESIAANVVKKNEGINIIMGNPPYSGISSNSGEWISRLIEDYKYINGVHFKERKHWLQDDYVKFIRFSESHIEGRGYGLLAFINNHAFIDNPTFRCMRWHLLRSFDKLYILDLHGSTKKHEVLLDGEKDENVFDIQQGVSINIFVKERSFSKGTMGTVYHADLYGSREQKYNWLNATNFHDIQWKKINYTDPYYFFVERDETNRNTWEKAYSIKDIMPYNSTGILTARDSLVVDMNREVLQKRIETFVDQTKNDDEIRSLFFGKKTSGKYLPGDTRGWSLSRARRLICNFNHSSYIQKVTYRPFDDRYIYYCPEMVDWGRFELMRLLLNESNIALVVTRQAITDNWTNAFVSQNIVDDSMVSNRTKERGYVFPLYLDNGLPNISDSFIDELSVSTGMSYKRLWTSDKGEFTAEDVFNYIYAVLYSNHYRTIYKDQLKADFPRIPLPESKERFLCLATLGNNLRKTHLLQSREDYSFELSYHGPTVCEVKNILFSENKVYINGKNAFFDEVDDQIWNFSVGAYMPLQKWLKDRKGTLLNEDDLRHYAKIINALNITNNTMREIDKILNPNT